jgi:hypothetical protein
MLRLSRLIRSVIPLAYTLCTLLLDVSRFLCLCLRPSPALAAENLFLQKQLALYQEHHVKPRRVTHATRVALVWLSWWCEWRSALTVVQPETFMRWRRQGFRLFWHGTPSPGRPPIPVELQVLIRQMTRDNLTWGQCRIANELRLKLGLRVSPRTVRKYMPMRLLPGPGQRPSSQRWRTFVRNHASMLIVSGMAADLLTRGVQALSAQIRRCLHRWWGRAVAPGVQGSAPRDAIFLALLIDMRSVPAAWFSDHVKSISEDDRSPPAMGPPHIDGPCTAARATPVETLALRPAASAGCWWHRAKTGSRNAKPLSTRASQVALLQQAA